MDENQVRETIYEIVVNSEALQGGNVIEYDTKLSEIGLDSVGMIDIIVQIEEEFEFEFAVQELLLENFASINSIAVLVISKLSQ